MASTARLDELKKKFDENPRRYFAPLANEHRKSGDLDQAIALCRTHLPQQPAHISGHIVLAQALYEAGSLDESREIFHTALGLDPENLIALRYLGDIARDSEDVATARSWYQRVLEVDPRNEEIVQLVQDLDSPRPSGSVAQASAHAAEPEWEEAPPPAEAAPPARPQVTRTPENDPRFAPLSLEHVDFGTVSDAPMSGADGGTPAAPSSDEVSDISFVMHGAWSTDAPTREVPPMDAEIDPFDLDPAASAEALFDPSQELPPDDIFKTAPSDVSSPDEATHADAEYSVAGAWSPVPETAPTAPPAALPTAPPAAPPTPISEAMSVFEEGSFYLEAHPERAGEAVPIQDVTAYAPIADDALIEASSAETAAWELPEAPSHASVDAAPAVPASQQAPEAAPELDAFETVGHATPNADASVDVTEAPTAEWRAPQSPDAASSGIGSDSVLGLEVMEFVPPPSEGRAVPATPATPSASEAVAPPAAFVTETMAELYLQQGFRDEALAVYRELLARSPDDANLRDRIDQIESGSMASIGMARVSEDVVESALRRQSARPARSVRSFFASFAGRRAPHRSTHYTDDDAADVSAFAPNEPVEADPEGYVAMRPEYPSSEPAAVQNESDEPRSTEPAVPGDDDERVSPMSSAAETLTSFDPFIDPFIDPSDVSPPTAVDASDAAPNAEPPAPQMSAPEPAESGGHPEPPRRSLEDFFPDAPVTPRTEAVAQTLATAFGRLEPQGRPTRAANSELSLDKVFRGTPEGPPTNDGGFSFDQFFSDARSSGSDVGASTMSPAEAGRSGGAGDAHDIEQFTAWLEGLKKK